MQHCDKTILRMPSDSRREQPAAFAISLNVEASMDMRAWTPMSAYTSSTSCWRGLRCTPLPDGSKCAAITAFAAVAAAFFRCCCVRGRIASIGAALRGFAPMSTRSG